MTRIKIGNKYIGHNEPVFIIAEIGSNHNRDFKTGKKLIDAAFDAKVDAVKFQSFQVKSWISSDFKSFSTLNKKQDIYKQLKKCELPYGMYKKLKLYAKKKGLICFSSPSTIEDVDMLDEIGIPAFKFGSVQITDLPTIEYAARKQKPIILSTGSASLREIEEALGSIFASSNRHVVLLHCTVLYPTAMDQVNLRAMVGLRNRFNVPVGYSDHTLDPVIVPIAAVGLGACVIEKHITLSRESNGPDHSFALEPQELKDMVEAIRTTEKALGSGLKRQLPEEKDIVIMGRRSIIAQTDIPKGIRISRGMLTTKRPGTGITPKYLPKIIGRVAKRDIFKDEILKWRDLK